MQHDLDALCARDDVGIGHDVSVFADDDPGSDRPLASNDQPGVATTYRTDRAISSHHHLDDAWRHLARELFE